MIGDHFYTTSSPEADNAVRLLGYQIEGIAWYAFVAQNLNAAPLYRLFSTKNGDHFYTSSEAERDSAIKKFSYRIEGTSCYVFSSQSPNAVPLYRLLNSKNGDHFYTASEIERDNAVRRYGYQIEGVACFVLSAQVAGATPVLRLLKVTDPPKTPPPPPPSKAQLICTNTWLGPTNYPTPGQPFAVNFSFANSGQAATGAFTVRLVLTDRGTLSSTNYDIQAPSYAPGTGDVAFWTFPNGLAQGSYVVDAYLDVFNQVSESFEGLGPHYCSNGFIVS